MDISPDKQNIDSVFSNTTYYIDFYQRDYRWTDAPVSRLLDDVFFKFREQYQKSQDLDPGQETITAKYPWYYLNTYVTNVVDGRVYVVDGQQRLTTISLILIKLNHLAKSYNSPLLGWLESKVAGQSGYEREFWMNHVGHRGTQQALLNEEDLLEIDISSGQTAENMVSNFRVISRYLDSELGTQHIFETFVFYFLYRLVLINLSVEQTDVSMVFEVINDRGIKLRPYEILKGKLLGQINKIELDERDYNGLWETQAGKVNAFKEDELDEFFRFYLKSKYASSRRDGTKFDGDYHRAMFSSEMESALGLVNSPGRVKEFLNGDFVYYSDLYSRVMEAYRNPGVEFQSIYYNSLLDIDAPLLLILSACGKSDADEDEKIETLGHEIDRYFSLLQLQGAYDSNEFSDSLYLISNKIRVAQVSDYRIVFDHALTSRLASRRNVSDPEPLSYAAFKQTGGSLNMRFKRYFFARVDHFLAAGMNLNPKHSLSDLVTKTGAKNGFHIEHILSWNDENRELFDNDEDRFEIERNRLGGILLLKGKDNTSSNNETYDQKLRSYANSLYWNETLREDSYKSKLDMDEFLRKYNIALQPISEFGPEQVESRQRLLFELSRLIWC